jgi:hypothetical protein
MQDLAHREIERNQAMQSAIERESQRRALWVQQTTALWSRLQSGLQERLAEYNGALSEPIAFLRNDGSATLEIIKQGRLTTIGHAHLSSSTECIEFTIRRGRGPVRSAPILRLDFFLAFGVNTGQLSIRQIQSDEIIPEEILFDRLAEGTLRHP